MFYQVEKCRNNSQFYVTDSIKHFVIGSVYFYKTQLRFYYASSKLYQNDMQIDGNKMEVTGFSL
jgi:hypothetical protein